MSNVSQFNIRIALEHDVPVILKFVRELAQYENAAHEVVATEEVLHQSMFGKTRYAHGLIVETGVEAVGFALYFFSFSTWQGRPGLYLEDLYIAPQHRNAGIGKAVLRRLAQIALAHGCGRFEWSVLDWNEPSIRFYEKMGAVAQKEWVRYRLSGEALEALAG